MTKPRYMLLAEQLVQQIGSGAFAVGSSMPSEFDLSEQFGVSRATVRSALKRVQELGLISRRKKAGIRVEAIKPPVTFEQSMSTLEDLVQFASATDRQILNFSEIVADTALAAALLVQPGSHWLKIEQIRIDPANPGLPICWSEVYVEAAIGLAIKRKIRSSTGLICELVEERFGRAVQEVRQEIRSVGVPEGIAEVLKAKPDAHALQIVRHYLDQNAAIFEVTVSVFPADRFSYGLQLKRQSIR